MTTWRMKTEQDRQHVLKVIQHRALPSTVEIVKGLKKSHEQEKLARKWHKEAEEQGDMTAEEYRAYCKLHFGVAIMKSQSELYAEKYDRIVKPLPYAQKLELMAEPFDFPVTRGMSTANEKKYLDQVYQFYTAKGFRLTDPDSRGEPVDTTKAA
jgi:hypothetical protein